MKFARLIVFPSLCVIAAGAAAHLARSNLAGCHTPISTGIEHCHAGATSVFRGQPVFAPAPAPLPPSPGLTSFAGQWSQYTVATGIGFYIVTHNAGAEPPRTVASPRLRFADAHVALDTEAVPGQIYRLYLAALNRSPDASGVGFHMASMEIFGLSLVQIADQFMASPEFTNLYGNLSNGQFVTQLYRNVLRREPDPGGHAFHTGNLDFTRLSRAQVLIQFSESNEYQDASAAAIANGIAYVPYEPPASAPVSPFGR